MEIVLGTLFTLAVVGVAMWLACKYEDKLWCRDVRDVKKGRK